MNITPVILSGHVNKTGKTNIKIKISKRSESRYIGTEFFIDPDLFRKNGTVADLHPNSAHINLELKQICLNYERKLLSVDIKKLHINRIIEILKDKTDINDFTAYFKKFIENKKTINIRTAEIYQATLNKIENFDSRKPLIFEDITAGWLRKFESSMQKDELKVNTISISFRNIRAVFNSAIDDELISLDIYPFRRFKIKNAKTKKRSITIEQLCKIRDFSTIWPVNALARDLFMMSFYLIGTNNHDLYNLKKITNGRIKFSRAKTHRNYSIKIEPEAAELIEKLKGKENLLKLSEMYDTVHNMTHSVNKALKRIGIVEELTMYHARHTWATIAKNNCRASDEDIAAALGHSRDTTTSIYIDYDPAIVDRLNREVLNCIV